MAMLSGDERSTRVLSRLVIGLDGGEKLLASAVEEARRLVASPPDALWLDDEDKAKLAKFDLLESICKKAFLEAADLPMGRIGASSRTL
jgi:RNase H-fold protein (predicted Holliday junction resolvase)